MHKTHNSLSTHVSFVRTLQDAFNHFIVAQGSHSRKFLARRASKFGYYDGLFEFYVLQQTAPIKSLQIIKLQAEAILMCY